MMNDCSDKRYQLYIYMDTDMDRDTWTQGRLLSAIVGGENVATIGMNVALYIMITRMNVVLHIIMI
jgi:hypothetical protein